MTTIVWFRRDLRVHDNAALFEAALRGPVLPVYIDAPDEEAPWVPGAASRWWLHHSLKALESTLRQLGLPLILRKGDSLTQLRQMARETSARAVAWNRLYEPTTIPRDTRVKEALRADGLQVHSHPGWFLHEPHRVQNKQGTPFKVFTPYWRHLQTLDDPPEPLPPPPAPTPPEVIPDSQSLASLDLLPRINWDARFPDWWTPGEAAARSRLTHFLDAIAGNYGELRNRPDLDGTSRLSAPLHFGEISPRDVWHQSRRAMAGASAKTRAGIQSFLREVGWREFSGHLLFHFPQTAHAPLRPEFERFPWRRDEKLLRAWQRGRTGYPIVDAGMRQLWSTGWMHNRVRMIVASFLVKHLLHSWNDGAAWFWDTLVDADLGNNTMGWQWSGGCGADAAPYFRIFNPVAQGEKFDPKGAYTRQWVPEIANMPDKFLFSPWDAPPSTLAAAGVRLGENYPRPIVDHRQGRETALAAFQSIRGPKSTDDDQTGPAGRRFALDSLSP